MSKIFIQNFFFRKTWVVYNKSIDFSEFLAHDVTDIVGSIDKDILLIEFGLRLSLFLFLNNNNGFRLDLFLFVFNNNWLSRLFLFGFRLLNFFYFLFNFGFNFLFNLWLYFLFRLLLIHMVFQVFCELSNVISASVECLSAFFRSSILPKQSSEEIKSILKSR